MIASGYHFALAQNEISISPKSSGLAYVSASAMDEWSAFNNPAGAALCDRPIVATTVDMVPAFPAWSRFAVSATMPFLHGAISAGALRTGDALLSTQILCSGYANKFGITSLGVSAQLIQVTAEGYGTKLVPTFSAGGITELYPWLSVGAFVQSVTQPKISGHETLGPNFVAGASFKISESVSCYAEVEKNLSADPTVKVAISYEFRKNFIVRTGFQPSPLLASFGFGFRKSRLAIDYSYVYLPGVISRHQGGCSYIVGKPK